MAIVKPYKRTVRQLVDGSYANSGNGQYINHPDYAVSPENYVRAFLLLQKDAINIFEYIEPADQNLNTYSFRIHELLMRICIEIEANCKAILIENGYTKNPSDMTMADYKKIEVSHRLSSYAVKFPHWKGRHSIFTPFSAWSTGSSLTWYQKYNQTKHNRHDLFHEATFEQMLSALCGLLVLITAQFRDEDFMSSSGFLVCESRTVYEDTIGRYFQIKYPNDWPADQRYDFDWRPLSFDAVAIQCFDYDAIP